MNLIIEVVISAQYLTNDDLRRAFFTNKQKKILPLRGIGYGHQENTCTPPW